MKNIITNFIILVLVFSTNLYAQNIYTLINKGKLKEASDSLSNLSTASLRDGNHLFFQGLIEENADDAARKFEAALKASVSPIYQQEIYLRLASYYFLKENYPKLNRILADYKSKWENGKYLQQMMRFSIIVDQQRNEYENAIKQADRYLLMFSKGDAYQQGVIDKAQTMISNNKRIGADNLLKKIAREKKGIGVPQSLYIRANEAIRTKRIDDAVFFYNLLRESYPSAVGLDAIINSMMNVSTSETADDRAEKFTDTFYSIQVGVFSKKGNAKKQASIFDSYGQKIEIRGKKISNKKYHVVYVGKFKTFAEASMFKNKLEINHNDVYQVIAR